MRERVPVPESERTSLSKLTSDLLFRNWGLKAIAFVLAVVMFVSTRDEVTRVFTVPLKIVQDPTRVLLTELPPSIQVQARGPWIRINRLQNYDFGSATLDLRAAQPGPLEIDRATIVMPSGVVLSNMLYDHVDLRFDQVIERDIEVKPMVKGDPALDYELIRVEVVPTRWRVRGGATSVRKVTRLPTEDLDIEGADHDVEVLRPLLPPPDGVTYVDEGQGEAQVTVRVVIDPKQETRTVQVGVVMPDGLDPTGAVPRTYRVDVTGPLPDFHVLDGLGVELPVEAVASKVEGEGGRGGGVAEVRFGWAEGVPDDLRERLSFDHEVERIELPPPPSPQEPIEAPGEGRDGRDGGQPR